jgi:hypothetical protein
MYRHEPDVPIDVGRERRAGRDHDILAVFDEADGAKMTVKATVVPV